MDKRFFMAILLTLIVVAITPILFPGTMPRAVPSTHADSLRADSLRRARGGAAAATPAAATGGALDAAPGAAPGAAPAGDTAAIAAAAVRAETTVVTTKHAIYHFSNVGAVPLSVELRDHQSLRPGEKGQPVRLGSAAEPLLRFRLAGADSAAFARTPFAVQHTGAGTPDEALRYEAMVDGQRVIVGYRFVPDDYRLRVTAEVQPAPGAAPAPAGRFLLVDLPGAIRSVEADTTEDQHNLAYAYKPVKGDAESVAFGKLDPGETRLEDHPLRWVAAKSKYFVIGLLTPEQGQPFAELHLAGAPRAAKVQASGLATVVAPVSNGAFAFDLYAGPQEWRRMRALGSEFENVNPYGGWLRGVVQPFATIIMRVLLWMHQALSLSYGWVLILFGLAIRIALWPLNQRAMRANLRMQRVQPEIQELQKRYRDDPAKQQAEMMRVYKAHGMSMFSPLSGCLPALIPMPVLIALFYVFRNTIEFRGVPFGWLPDISLHDPLYILPILVGITALAASWIGMRNMPPNPQTQMMGYIFPVMMTVLFIKFPSGLNLYYATQNVATIPQQWILAHERGKNAAAPVVHGTPAKGTAKVNRARG